jgi:uncharacterized protein YndB with AHSA1/START domain
MSDITATASTRIAATADQVWRALTYPPLITEYYLGATVSTDWQVGSPITWSGEWNGAKYEDKGEILEFEPNHRLSYTHWSPTGGTEDSPENYHVVTVVLAEAGDETEVTLTQSNLEGGVTDTDRRNREDYEANWSTMLDGLKRTVESRSQVLG